MENKTRGTGKAKKVVIGVATIVAVAAIAVPTALTLTGGNKDAGASTSNNKYNVIVSSGIDGVPDYSLTIADGTKISELKSILKGVDGYKIEGIYKDDAMNHPYADNETISSSTKIYIKFVAVVYTVNIYAEDGITLLETQEVNHKDSLTLTAPTKSEDNFATYEFKGWYNERNEQVNLNEITSDLNIHPYFETHMKDYRIGFIYEAFKSSVSVTIGGTPVTLDSTYHYGAKIVIRATQKVGRDITEFKVKVGSGETQNILTEAYRHEENGQVYYEYELDGNGDLSIIYSEAASEYSIGTIPSQVTVTRNGHTLSSNEAIYYGDQLTISYTESEGHHKETFAVNGAEYVGGVWIVKGDLTISYTEAINSYEVKFYSEDKQVLLGSQIINYGSAADINIVAVPEKEVEGYNVSFAGWTDANGNPVNLNNITDNINVYASYRQELKSYTIAIPDGVSVNGKTGSIIVNHFETITVSYAETVIRETGNTKEEDGYNYTEKETITNVLTLNGERIVSGYSVSVEGDLTLNLTSSSEKNWEKGNRIEYSVGNIPSGVMVRRGNETLNSDSVIYWGDELTFTYTETSTRLTGNTKQESGYNWSERETIKSTLSVNGTNMASGYSISVTENITLNLSSSSTKTWEQGTKIEYRLGAVPSGVTVKRNGTTLSSNSIIYWGDELTFTYSESTTRYTGNTKQEAGYNYSEKETIARSLIVNGTTMSNGSKYTAYGDVTLTLNTNTNTSWEKGTRIEYRLGAIPSGVTVKRNGTTLSSNSTIYWGDNLTFTYTESSTRLTGNTKQELGYNYLERENITNTLSVNDTIQRSGGNIIVTENISLRLNSDSIKTWEKGSIIEYSIGIIPSGVTVKRSGATLSNHATIYYGDSLTFTYTDPQTSYTGKTKVEEGYNYKEKQTITYSLTANQSSVSSGGSFSVTGDVTLNLTSSTTSEWERGSRVSYSVGKIPSGIIVYRNGVALSDYATIYYGEELSIEFKSMILITIQNQEGSSTSFATLKINGKDVNIFSAELNRTEESRYPVDGNAATKVNYYANYKFTVTESVSISYSIEDIWR